MAFSFYYLSGGIPTQIHVVTAGETLYAISARYGIPLARLAAENGLRTDSTLAVGQALLILTADVVHTVAEGETLTAIAEQYGVTVRQLYRNNPLLDGLPLVYPGQTLVISFTDDPTVPLQTNSYAYPFITDRQLRGVLPFLTYLAPFTYGFTETGELVMLSDERLLTVTRDYGTLPLMHISTLTDAGVFSNALSHIALSDPAVGDTLIAEITRTVEEKGYVGADVDFEFILAEDALAYGAFLQRLRTALAVNDKLLFSALAPKTSADQPGLLYQGHNYAAVGAAVDYVLLMTYEWGYTYGPPMAVAPLPNVRRVVEYALSEIPAQKIFLGAPNYGYDWPLPFVRGETRATSISPERAVELAVRYGAEIQYDTVAEAPFFEYRDENGVAHVVWYEDVRSIAARLQLPVEYGLPGVGFWDAMRPAIANFMVLNALYRLIE